MNNKIKYCKIAPEIFFTGVTNAQQGEIYNQGSKKNSGLGLFSQLWVCLGDSKVS